MPVPALPYFHRPRTSLHGATMLLCMVLACAAVGAAHAAQSIVPEESRISTPRARLEVARLLARSTDPQERARALAHYRQLSDLPADLAPDLTPDLEHEARLEQADLLLEADQPGEVVALLKNADDSLRASLLLARAHTLRGNDHAADEHLQAARKRATTVNEQRRVADTLLALGRTAKAREVALMVWERANTPDLQRWFMNTLSAWGAYDRAARLTLHFDQPYAGQTVDYARALTAGQRFVQAEGALRSLLARQQDTATVLLELAEVRLRAQDFAGALQALDLHNERFANDTRRATTLRLETLLAAGDTAAARQVPTTTARHHILHGLAAHRAGDEEAAREAFTTALRMGSDDPLPALLGYAQTEQPTSATELVRWGRAAMQVQMPDAAEVYARQAVARAPRAFAPRFFLIEVLAARREFAEALQLAKALHADYPDSSQAALTHARLLGWDQHFDASIDAYRAMLDTTPDNHTARREMARTAYWAKKGDLGARTYGVVADAREDSPSNEGDTDLPLLDAAPAQADQWAKRELATRFTLERSAKSRAYHTRFGHAIDANRALLAREPGNAEMRFDLAQNLCTLGLVDDEKQVYAELLERDPYHSLADLALHRARARDRPELFARMAYWNETGRGDLSRMQRTSYEAGGSVPVHQSLRLHAAQLVWHEEPTRNGESSTALGQRVGFSGPLNSWLSARGQWTQKRYTDDDLGTHNTGEVGLGIDLNGYAALDLSWMRELQLANAFARDEGVHLDTLRLRADSRITRGLRLGGSAAWLDYSDGNEGYHATLDAALQLNDHPETLTLEALLVHRDTRRDNRFLFSGDQLTDIVHPYWTPQDYWGFEIGPRARFDLAELYFCGAREHSLELAARTGFDTEENPFFRAEGSWRMELDDDWRVEASLFWHRSDQWDAEGAWLGLYYRLGSTDADEESGGTP